MSEPRVQQTRPPVPALIPLAALRPAPPAVPEVTAAATASSPCVAVTAARAAEDEDGGTRTRRPNAARAIDAGAWSRDARAPSPRRTAQRHRKSDRRRRERALLHASAGDINDVDKNRHLRKQRRRRRSGGCATSTTHSRVNKHRSSSSSNSTSGHVASPPAAPPPRVNPIFLWVRQEDTHIVEVRCEDYDKRNRIRLTKTPHGWRAIPRTETLAVAVTVPQQPAVVDSVPATESTVVKQRKNRKSSKSKRKASVEEVCSESRNKVDVEEEEQEESTTAIIQTREESSSPAWSAPVNIESHLPSHTIAVPRKKATAATSASVGGEEDDGGCSVNSVVECTAPPRDPGTVGGGGDATALDNLLAVAELEFNHQVQQEAELEQEAAKVNEDNYSEPSVDEINETPIENISDQDDSVPSSEIINERNYSDITEQHKEFFENIVQLNKLIESRSERVSEPSTPALPDQSASDLVNSDRQTEDCDYNDDDENNLAMDDIITRLEQSLQSPEACAEVDELCAEATSYIAFDDDTRVRDATDDAKGEEVEQNYDASESQQQHADDEESDIEIKAEVSCPQDLTEMDLSVDVPTSQNEGDDMLPTDLSITTNEMTEDVDKEASAIEIEEPTDLSTNSKRENIVEDEYEDDECVESTEDDLMPTDLSIPKHIIQTPPRTETPRPASHGSETIQSPQPSGIPAVPPSPDILSSNSQKSKSIFLETLLSSTSPKLCLTPEVTITRQQKEPLDLGKSRKSASPTVTCSEEAKSITKTNNNPDGEPAAKRLKMEDITLKNLLHMERKNKPEVTISKSVRPIDKVESPNQKLESSRLLELLTNEADPDPVTQLKQILADPELNIPDPLLVPKDRLSQILSAPAREIPRLLALRPELRLPEALAFPQLLQDPDILVISLAQLQTILHKQNETLKLQETTRPQEKPSPKVASPTTKKVEEKTPAPANYNSESHRYPSATTLPGKDARGSVGALAGDIDAATTAAFNQMLWLPYLSQLEAAAMACGNNNEFMKALNSIFPPSFPPPDPTQMFGRFSTPPFPMHPPPPVDYTNQLEIALWQEAMLKANINNFGGMQHPSPMHQRSKNPVDSISLKSAYRENGGLPSNKKPSVNQRVHSSARTSPIAHTFQQQKPANVSGSSSSNSIPPNPYLNSIPSAYQLPNTNLRSQSLQIPQYNPSLAQWSRTSTSSHSSRASSNSSRLSTTSSVPNHHNHYSTNSKLDYFKHHPNMNAAAYGQQQRYNQHLSSSQHIQQQSQQKPVVQQPQPQQQQQHHHQQPKAPTSEQQRPRVTCKSLQNLLSPSRLSQEMNALKRSHEITTSMTTSRVPPPPSATQPIDLSGVPKSASSKLKIKQHLSDNTRLPPKLFKHDEVPEVGSTTSSIDEMTSAQLTDAQTHLWHPLFGNLSSRTKIDSIHERVRSVPVIASE